ncbi:ArdC-like ssDNA-binding domain-containing protein [Pontibacillus yanchengensis]|nr:ArdC-like ssDNA-binding domain-containing protein [Pontibacillus yanchengensis]
MMSKKNHSKSKKQTRQEKVDEAFELIEEGIQTIAASTKQYQNFLKFSSKHYQYSLRNQVLIFQQMPNARFVAGFNTWKKHDRHVKKGEKGIKIIARGSKVKEVENENGEKELQESYYYFVTHVFDISQTEGEDVPSFSDLIKTIKGETELYEKVKSVCSFPVYEKADSNGADGYFDLKNKLIVIQRKNPSNHKLLTLIHEWGHGILHNDLEKRKELSRQQRELEAESVGFTVCHVLGIDTSQNSFGYLASFGQSKTIELIKQSEERIQMAVKEILSKIDEELQEDNEGYEVSA